MKKLMLVTSLLCLLAGMAVAQNPQNVFVQTVPVTMTQAPVGTCNQAAFQIAYVPSTKVLYTCDSTANAWVQSGAVGSTTGTGAQVLQTSPTITTPTITAPVVSTITNTGTVTLPTTTGGVPVVIGCGSTTTGTAACANTALGATAKVYSGVATLASNAQVITLTPGFTATTSYQCVGNDITTRANPVQVISTSATTITITNTTGASDVINWICVGN